MTGMILPTGTWIFVCDGAKARCFANKGTAAAPRYSELFNVHEDHAATRDSGASAPGRVHESGSSSRSSVEQTDWHDLAERDFISRMIERLDHDARKEGVTGLVVVAPPRALAVVRHAMTPALKAILISEVNKDLAGLPTVDIERHLAG